jgi:ClpP class serine protease
VTKRLKKVGISTAVGLAVVVNSPGGLPVQSQIIGEKLQDFASKHNLKLYTFARDVAASGGYVILSAGDHVVADRSSIVGSIGVVFTKLKLRGLLDRLSLDHKHFSTNEYCPPHLANCFRASFPPTRTSPPPPRST